MGGGVNVWGEYPTFVTDIGIVYQIKQTGLYRSLTVCQFVTRLKCNQPIKQFLCGVRYNGRERISDRIVKRLLHGNIMCVDGNEPNSSALPIAGGDTCNTVSHSAAAAAWIISAASCEADECCRLADY